MTQTQRIGLLLLLLALFSLLWRYMDGNIGWTEMIIPVFYGAAGAALFVRRSND